MTRRAPIDIDIQAGERVRAFRLKRDLTLAELGRELGISHQQLQKYETGSNRMSVGMLVRVAAALKHPVTDFIDEPKAPKVSPALSALKQANALIENAMRHI